jgi:hypothetical protein
MVTETPSPGVLEREYLPTRAKILEIAATLDRIARLEPHAVQSHRWGQLQAALKIVLEQPTGRAEGIQLLLSRTYDENWQTTLQPMS